MLVFTVSMISRNVYWRSILRDRIFISLLTMVLLTIVAALTKRRPSLETSPMPFQLALLFFFVNVTFAFLTIRREPLLAYMFLTATVLGNGTLYFFYRYLIAVQGG